ncbi:MAG: hypothetical protein WCY36_04660 [Candidatus Omnitrophota bacterium]
MAIRKQISGTTEADILLQSRRRCCVCFGLHRDDSTKRGQIAHLDGNPENDNLDNLVFLCFDHHDEFDSSTSQSKGLTIEEVRRYREELYSNYEDWNVRKTPQYLLNFLASTIDNEAIADAAVKVPPVFYREDLAYEVLTKKELSSCDGDIYIPWLVTLDSYTSWGLLTYEEEESEEDGFKTVYIKINHKPICEEIAKIVIKRKEGHEKK